MLTATRANYEDLQEVRVSKDVESGTFIFSQSPGPSTARSDRSGIVADPIRPASRIELRAMNPR